MVSHISTPTTRTGVFFEPARKRFQQEHSETEAYLYLDGSGMISDLSGAARHLLEYGREEAVEPCFFSLVHGKNQYQVMRDVADMIVHGKRAATWFLRLRTGRKRWQWYRAYALNELKTRELILVRLHEATSDW